MSDLSLNAPSAAPALRAGQAHAREAIARAAQRTGVDFDYLLAQAKLESGLDPSARARTSSAAGLYQFTRGTWMETLRKHGAEHGLAWAQDAAGDPARSAQVLTLRHDPQVAALMAAELAGDNSAALEGALGRRPDSAELYLAHFLGIGGATRLLSAAAGDPGQPAAALLPDAARANRAIFFEGGAPRSVEGVIGLLRTRLSAAMEGGEMPGAIAPGLAGQWQQQASLATPATLAAAPLSTLAPGRASMAETLRQAFNVGGTSGQGGSAPSHVSYAYRRLSALGL